MRRGGKEGRCNGEIKMGRLVLRRVGRRGVMGEVRDSCELGDKRVKGECV